MKDRKKFRAVMVVICFIAAGMNGYKIIQGDYTYMDVFLVVVFLLFAGIYIYLLRKKQDKPDS